MKRVRPDVPKLTARKGVWRMRGAGRRKSQFIPFCACGGRMKRYARATTRLDLWREAKTEQTCRQRRKHLDAKEAA